MSERGKEIREQRKEDVLFLVLLFQIIFRQMTRTDNLSSCRTIVDFKKKTLAVLNNGCSWSRS
jgi:hypothetical protein